jgi:hypothetical protein
LWIISQVELSSFYFKLTKKSMFPVLYDSAGPPVYEAVSPISASVLLRDFATPAAGSGPAPNHPPFGRRRDKTEREQVDFT